MFCYTDYQNGNTGKEWGFFFTSGRSWNWSASDDGGALAIETGGVLGSVAAVTSTYKTEDERGMGYKKKNTLTIHGNN